VGLAISGTTRFTIHILGIFNVTLPFSLPVFVLAEGLTIILIIAILVSAPLRVRRARP